MKYEKIIAEIRDDVGILKLNEPDKLNAITIQMLDEINTALDYLTANAGAIVITGEGRAFCSGASLDGGMGEISLALVRVSDVFRAGVHAHDDDVGKSF